ncbi:MAG TPA: SIMPL domain-containing protein [Streptosporangiaceae bacterium]|nr:SIMPL domain-containing protein [Streptosporangiaceae bacterium]
MNGEGSPLLSVRAEARHLVPPDYAVVDGQIEHTAGSKAEAVRSVTGSLDRLTADLAALGAVPFDEDARRRPLTWSAHSSATHEEFYHDQQTGGMQRTGQVTATVALRVTVRDLDALDELGGVLAAAPDLNVHGVTWHIDWDNPAWPQVRAAAIGAAIGKARDYAAALGATVRHVEHIADAGLLGGDAAPSQPVGFVTAKAFGGGGGDRLGTPALTPVPQELIATIEARFRTTEVSLPSA